MAHHAGRFWATTLAVSLLGACGPVDYEVGSAPPESVDTDAGGGAGPAGGAGASAAQGGMLATGGSELAGSGPSVQANAGAGGDVNAAGAAGTSGAGIDQGPGCVIFVDAEHGSDTHDGRSWEQALSSLSAGLSRAGQQCEVWVTAGRYLPGSGRASTFAIAGGVTLRGGFRGDEASPDERGTQTGPTLLSGDLGTPLDASDNSYHVLTTLGSATLDRITVSDGSADQISPPDDHGAGILAGGPLTLTDVNVSNNRCRADGAGVFATLGLVVSGGSFSGNVAGGSGGAIATTVVAADDDDDGSRFAAAVAKATLTISGARFEANQASDGAAIYATGALELTSSQLLGAVDSVGIAAAVLGLASVRVDDCNFEHNQRGLAIENRGWACSGVVTQTSFSDNGLGLDAGAIYASQCPLTVTYSTFEGNRGNEGGAIDFVSFEDPSLELTIQHSSFHGNAVANQGGSVYSWGGHVTLEHDSFEAGIGASAVYAYEAPSVVLRKCRFVSNEGGESAGALTLQDSNGQVWDSEFWHNTSARAGAILLLGGGLSLTNVTLAGNIADNAGFQNGTGGGGLESYGPAQITNSIFWGNRPSEIMAGEYQVDTPPGPVISASNFTANDPARAYDPHFVDPETDLSLKSDSPCIDTADDTQAAAGDLVGEPRHDLSGVPVCPVSDPACGSVTDMGAREYVP